MSKWVGIRTGNLLTFIEVFVWRALIAVSKVLLPQMPLKPTSVQYIGWKAAYFGIRKTEAETGVKKQLCYARISILIHHRISLTEIDCSLPFENQHSNNPDEYNKTFETSELFVLRIGFYFLFRHIISCFNLQILRPQKSFNKQYFLNHFQ